MIAQMKTLLRVKTLKEEQALRAMQAKRQQAEIARAESERARDTVEESSRTYASREETIYAEILGSVIDQNDVDVTRGKVVLLEKQHNALKDALERALHVEHRLVGELKDATERYHAALRKSDKFRLITDDLVLGFSKAVEGREEAEVEDLFAVPRARFA